MAASVIRNVATMWGSSPSIAHGKMGTWDTFVLWADLGISFLVMVVGMFLVPGLGLGAALLAILVGSVIGNVLLGLAAGIGFDTGMPTMALLRGPLGVRGSYDPDGAQHRAAHRLGHLRGHRHGPGRRLYWRRGSLASRRRITSGSWSLPR